MKILNFNINPTQILKFNNTQIHKKSHKLIFKNNYYHFILSFNISFKRISSFYSPPLLAIQHDSYYNIFLRIIVLNANPKNKIIIMK